MRISRICGEKKPWTDLAQIITCFKFGDDRLRGLELVEGQSSPFLIDFDGRPYNTVILPCERVTDSNSISNSRDSVYGALQ